MSPQPGVPAFTVKQPDSPMVVLKERAKEIGVRANKEVIKQDTTLSVDSL